MNLACRNKIDQFEEEISKLPQIDLPVEHYFANGLYAREMSVPAGVMLTGKIHLTEHLSIISKGEVTFVNEDGLLRVKAPYTFVSQPGTKRAFHVHEDLVWTTVHATEETDIETLENTLVVNTYAELEADKVKRIED